MLSAKRAAEIARAHGLSPSDALAIQKMAADETEAVEVAKVFAPTPPPDPNDALRGKVAASKKRTSAARLVRGGDGS